MTTRYDSDPPRDYGDAHPALTQQHHTTHPSPYWNVTPSGPVAREPHPGHGHHGGQGGHWLMMLVCCIPMIVIAVVLAATGVAGSGALIGALLCVVMMAAMMFAMPGGHGHK